MKLTNMKMWGKTDIGRIRQINQDNFFCETIVDNIAIFCVCDGMGGTNGGHIASKYASREFIHEIKTTLRNDITKENAKKLLENAVNYSNSFVYDMANCDTDLYEMGTTLVGGFIINEEVYITNVGDSRCYKISKEEIIQITKDHSLVQQLFDNGEITEEEKRHHPQKNYITRAVGITKETKTDSFLTSIKKGEYLVLCSDGLYNLIEDTQIKDITLKHTNIDEKCDEFIDIANKNGGTDNITVVIVEF